MMTYLEFEKPIEVLDNKIHELKTEVANSNELIDDNGTFQLRKRVVV